MEHWDRLRGDQGFYWDDGLFRPSTDTFLLGSFPVLRRGEQVCDLGAGTGLLGALLLTREPSLTVTGLELREDACRLARRTAQRSGWQERLLCLEMARRFGLEPKRLRLVQHDAVGAPGLVLLECRRGGKPGLRAEPTLLLYGPDGRETAEHRRAYFREEEQAL